MAITVARRVGEVYHCANMLPRDTVVGFRAYRSDLHRFYRMASDMIMSTLYDKWNYEGHAEHEPIGKEDIPF
jgi:hypothetical protein